MPRKIKTRDEKRLAKNLRQRKYRGSYTVDTDIPRLHMMEGQSSGQKNSPSDKNTRELVERSDHNMTGDVNDDMGLGYSEDSDTGFPVEFLADTVKELLGETEPSDPLYTGSDVAYPFSLALVMAFIRIFKLSQAATKGLLAMLSVLLPKPCRLPQTMYFLHKKLQDLHLAQPEKHFACPSESCGEYLGVDTRNDSDIFICAKCCSRTTRKNLLNYSFAVLPLSPYLKHLVELHTVPSFRDRISRDNSISDISTGRLLQKTIENNDGNFFVLSSFSDGKKISNSSQKSAWVLTWTLLGTSSKATPNLSTVFCSLAGSWKPSAKCLMTPFINEMNKLATDGLRCTPKGETIEKTVKVFLNHHIADSVDRYKIMGHCIFHNFYGCVHCQIKGQLINGRYCYPLEHVMSDYRDSDVTKMLGLEKEEEVSNIRNNVPYAEEKGYEYYKGVQGQSAFARLPYFDVTNGIPVEPMHNLFEGINKKIMKILLKGKMRDKDGNSWKITPQLRRVLDSVIDNGKPPVCVKRILRNTQFFGEWKASEHLQFCLYYALPALHAVLPVDHFLVLAKFYVAVQMCFQPEITVQSLGKIIDLIRDFLFAMTDVFGDCIMVYNMHQLIHLPYYIYQLGRPQEFWAFEQERYLGYLAKLLHGSQRQNMQLTNKVYLAQVASSLEVEHLRKDHGELVEEISFLDGGSRPAVTTAAVTSDGRVLFHGKPERSDLEQKYGNDVSGMLSPLIDGLENATGTPVTIRLFKKCTVESGYLLDVESYGRRERRVNNMYATNDGFFAASDILHIASGNLHRAVVIGRKTEELPENYFDFNKDSALQNCPKFFKFLRKTDDYVLHLSSEICSSVLVLKNDSSELLSIAIRKECCPD